MSGQDPTSGTAPESPVAEDSEPSAAPTYVVVRFLGDPVGYRVPVSTMKSARTEWMTAQAGISGRFVEINTAQAYLIEADRD